MTEFCVQDAWGVSSLRQCAGFPVKDKNHFYYAPLGCCVVQWNILTKEKTMFQAHNDLITVMLQSSMGTILTVSFGGDVKLWTENMTLLATYILPTSNVIYGSWSANGSLFSVSSKGPKQKVFVYDLQVVLDDYKNKVDVKYKWSYAAPQKERDDSISQGTRSVKKVISYDCFNAGIFKSNGELLAIYQSSNTCEIYLFSVDGKIIKIVDVSPLGDIKNIMLCVSKVHDDIIAVGLQNGVFGFYNVNTLNMVTVIQATGSPQVCIWNDETFVTMSYVSGVLSMWSKSGVLLKEFTGGPTGSIVQMNTSPIEKNSYWIGGIMSLHYITILIEQLKVMKSTDLSFLSLTGCGIAVNDHHSVASGDFTGKLLIWEYSKTLPNYSINVSSQIRCLVWCKQYLLIGCLDGELYSWLDKGKNLDTSKKDDLENIYNCYGGVVTMKLNREETKLAVGTTTGYVYVFLIKMNQNVIQVELLYQSLQHKPKKQGDGSDLPMEIWSLVWNVDDSLIATTSEDQTTAIAEADNGRILRILTGHTTAVTSVEWKLLSNHKNILATCADDQTVRIYDGIKFELIHVLDTYDIYGWHTLTYLAINNKNDLLICATQNGYLVVWDLNSYECLAKRKVHGGSIEGLVIDKTQEFILTTSSDCVVQRFSLKNSN